MHKRGIKQYKKEKLIMLFCLIALMVFLILLIEELWIRIVVFVACALLYKFLDNRLIDKNINKILTEDLDAKRFYDEVIVNSENHGDYNQVIVANWFVGNYVFLSNMLEQEYSLAKDKYKSVFLNTLQCVYFETNNFEKLVETHNKAVYADAVSYSFFHNYIYSDYSECLADCDSMEQDSTSKNNNGISKVRIDFMRAVVCYRMGDHQRAISLFESIVQRAPKCYYAEISSQYLLAIGMGDEQYISKEALFVNRYKVGETVKPKRRPLLVAIGWVFAVAVLIGFVFFAWLDPAKNPESTSTMNEEEMGYYRALDSSLDYYFEEHTALYIFGLGLEDLVLVEDENGLNVVGFISAPELLPKDAMKVYVRDFWFETEYNVYVESYDEIMTFLITESYDSISPSAFFVGEIELYEKMYYFSIEYMN